MGFLELIAAGEVALAFTAIATIVTFLILLRRLERALETYKIYIDPYKDPLILEHSKSTPPHHKRKPVVNDDEKAVRIERKKQEKRESLY